MKKYNFNAGPSMLPREVVEQTAAAVLKAVEGEKIKGIKTIVQPLRGK